MKFIEIKKDNISIDDSDLETKPIIEAFGVLIEKKGFDNLPVACGVMPNPDFGYFELAGRFWRASLCIYSFGATNCFWETGVGYAEPWLFNVRHAIELYVKGFLLSAIWLEELQRNSHLPIEKDVFENLMQALGSKDKKQHALIDLYNSYLTQITNVIQNWDIEKIPDIPEVNLLILKPEEIEMLKELDEADKTSFRFRYPSLKQGKTDTLQKIDWQHDPSMILPKTGLPKESGYFFDHVNVMNNLHKLVGEIKEIENYFAGISEYQNVMNEHWNDYLRELESDNYGY